MYYWLKMGVLLLLLFVAFDDRAEISLYISGYIDTAVLVLQVLFQSGFVFVVKFFIALERHGNGFLLGPGFSPFPYTKLILCLYLV